MIEIAEKAVACIGTPFRHQGRSVDHGLDCLGLVVVAVDGWRHDRRDYPSAPDTAALRRALDMHFDRLDVQSIEAAPIGSVVAFRYGMRCVVRHLAIRTPIGFVHAVRPKGVVETTIIEPWISRFEGAYAWRSSL